MATLEGFSGGAIRLMRSIKQRHPDAKAGKIVDPYALAYAATLDPDVPGYEGALSELVTAHVLKRVLDVEEHLRNVTGLNPQYRITPEGERVINNVGV